MGAPDVEVGQVRVEVFRNVPLGLDGSGSFDKSDCARSVVLPIVTDPQVEEDMLATVGNKEAENRCLNDLETFDLRAPENGRVDGKLRCTVEWLLALFTAERRCSAKRLDMGLYLSMTRTVTVAVDEGMSRAGAGVGSSRYLEDGMIVIL